MRTTPILVTVMLVALAAIPPPTASGEEEIAPQPAALVQQAQERWHLLGDATGALRLFNQAVDLSRGEPRIVLERAMFLEQVLPYVADEQAAAIKTQARSDYQQAATVDPDSIAAGIARDGLARIDGQRWFVVPDATCDRAALDAFRQAEKLFSASRYDEAIASYASATEACPESAEILVSFADAYFATGRYEQAAEIFEQALTVAPWHRSGHRFFADTLARLDRPGDGLVEAALAVVSDPTYEAAWGSLRSFAEGLGGTFGRVYGARGTVTVGEGDDGGTAVTISLPTADESTADDHGSAADGDDVAAGPDEDDDEVDADTVGWLMYGISKSLALTGTATDDATGDGGEAVDTAVGTAPRDAFEIERDAAEAALDGFDDGADADGFWGMMARAQTAGYLDEAIYLHLMDEQLVEPYLAFREQHAERLTTYLCTVVVQLPEDATAAAD